MILARLILAVISTAAEEAVILAVWFWVLPEFDIRLPQPLLIAVMVVWLVLGVFNFWLVSRILRKQTIIGLPAMTGSRGRVVSPIAPEGMVRIKGELWSATSIDGEIDTGEEITVTGQEGLKLTVRRGASEELPPRGKS